MTNKADIPKKLTGYDKLEVATDDYLDSLWRQVVRCEIEWGYDSTYWGINADDFFMYLEALRNQRGLWILLKDDPEYPEYEQEQLKQYNAAYALASEDTAEPEDSGPTYEEIMKAWAQLGYPSTEPTYIR